MKICVVTPYFETNVAWINQAHKSVREQTIPAEHIVVCDGSAPAQMENFGGTHIILQRNYQDYGNTPRLIGCYHAVTRFNADAVAFLDADNWYQPDHIEQLLTFVLKNRLDGACSARTLHRLDGSLLARCQRVNGQHFVDTNGILVMRSALHHLIGWVIAPQTEAAVADQFVWNHLIGSGARLGFLDRPTVCYRTRHLVHYLEAGEPPPPEAIDRVDTSGLNYR